MAETLPENESAAQADAGGAPLKKVELDLDDAPFLQVDEPAPPPAPVDDSEVVPTDDGATAKRKKKRIIILGATIGALMVIAAAVWWFFFRTPPPPPPTGPEPEVIVVPSQQIPAGPNDIVTEFAPFIIPVNDDPRQTQFLVCKFAAITQEPAVQQEMDRQRMALRDAIYFYLRGKDSQFLQNSGNYEAIKTDLLSVFNDYLTQGKLEDIVFESYLSH